MALHGDGKEATWNIITRKAWTAPPWRQQQPRRERQEEKTWRKEYQIFQSPQVRGRDWPQQICAAYFFFLYVLTDFFFPSIHCLVSSETLDLCVLLPYSSKFNLFPPFLSGTALANVLFVSFSNPPILHNDAILVVCTTYGTRSPEMHSLIFYCFPTHLFPADAYDYSYSDAACMCVCALAFPIISIWWCSSAPTNAHKNRIEKRKDSSTKGRNSWKKW